MGENLVIEHDGKIVFHPGSYIADLINDLDVTQNEFAKRLDTNSKTISSLVNGKCKVTPKIATKLAKYSGTSIDLWLNLQSKYDSVLEEINYEKDIENQFEVFKGIDYNTLSKMGYVPKVRDKKSKIKELCKFLRVSTLNALKHRELAISFRAAKIKNEKHVINTNVWIQMVANTLDDKPVLPFDKEKLHASLDELRSLTHKEPSDFVPKIKKILEECGVNFVLIPSIPNAQPKGMVMWKEERIILGMSNKGRFSDMFWFTLFHEIGHVLLHPNENFVDLDLTSTEEREAEADEFSKEILIPTDKFEVFTSKGQPSLSSIEKFADEVGVEKSIVIGRLQKEGYIDYSMYTKYKRKFIWKNN